MKKALLKPTKGRLLISVPFLNDYYFGRSVVLLTEHGKEGSVGLIINKPLDTRINDAIKDFPAFDENLYLGGPVEKNSLFYIHTKGDIITDSIEIKEGLYWGGDFEAIKSLIKDGLLYPGNIRFFVGYSGWAPFQLDRELREKSWVVSECDVNSILTPDPLTYWHKKLKNSSHKEYAVWADFPVNPSLN